MLGTASWLRWILILPMPLAGCWKPSVHAKEFTATRLAPDPSAEPLRLNDAVTVYFSEPVDPLSVTSDAVSVVDEEGHQVPGRLHASGNWVTFEPRPPLDADLRDGGFQPGRTYRLAVAGYPRPDALRSRDGRRLGSPASWSWQTVNRAEPSGLGMLRPVNTELPFVLRAQDGPQVVAADGPRLRLQFSLPVLPSSATPDAFQINWLGRPIERLVPKSVRVIHGPLDDYPGSTVEIDLGPTPRCYGSDSVRVLQAGDYLSVGLQGGEAPLRDHAGNAVFAPVDQVWSVVAGGAVAIQAWPVRDGHVTGDDPLLPGFEIQVGVLRPRARVEAGDGSLGVFRPRQDTVLQPGLPFDRGDGVVVVPQGGVFPFLSIDIPEGVTVRLRGEDLRLLAVGGIRIRGILELDTTPRNLVLPRHGGAVRELIDAASVALVAAGDVAVLGRIEARNSPRPEQSVLTIAAAGRIEPGDVPFHTVLAVEASPLAPPQPAIVGTRGQVVATVVTFTSGAPAGARWTARCCSPWRPMPADRDGGTVHIVGGNAGLHVAWQAAGPDPIRRDQPVAGARLPRAEPLRHGDRISPGAGMLLRFQIEAEVVGGEAMQVIEEIRLLDR